MNICVCIIESLCCTLETHLNHLLLHTAVWYVGKLRE